MIGDRSDWLDRQRVSIWLIWALLGLAAVAAIFLIPWVQVMAAFAHAQKAWILAALGICLLGAPITATEWWLYLSRQNRLAWGRMFEITALATTARSSLPFFAGDASSVGLLVTRGGLDPGAAVSVLTLDQLFTGLGKVAMVCATLAFAPLPPFLGAAGASLAALVAFAFAAMLIAALYGTSLNRVAAMFPPRAERAIRAIAKLTEHLELLRRPLPAAAAVALTSFKKLIEVGATLAIQHAIGIDLPPWSAILIVTAVNLAAVIPGPPAGLGVFEATALFTYHYLGVPPGTAFAAALLQHATYLTTDIGYGYVVFAVGQARNRIRALTHP